MQNPKDYMFSLANLGRPEFRPLADERIWPGIERYWPEEPILSRGNVTTLVIHATAGSSSEGAIAMIAQGAVAFHWCVPDEDEAGHGKVIWATWPESVKGVHCRWHNSSSLGIEIVNAQNGKDGFSDWQVRAAARIARYAWAKYPNLQTVCSHAHLDPSRREDPGKHFPWDRFRELVIHGDGVLAGDDVFVKDAKDCCGPNDGCVCC